MSVARSCFTDNNCVLYWFYFLVRRATKSEPAINWFHDFFDFTAIPYWRTIDGHVKCFFRDILFYRKAKWFLYYKRSHSQLLMKMWKNRKGNNFLCSSYFGVWRTYTSNKNNSNNTSFINLKIRFYIITVNNNSEKNIKIIEKICFLDYSVKDYYYK